MTTRWAYRCNEAGVSLERTQEILQKFDFCWRSAYARAEPTAIGMPPLIANVGKVHIRHDLLIYYATKDSSELLGAFEVTAPPKKLSDDRVTAVGIADDAGLVAALEGYGRDQGLYGLLPRTVEVLGSTDAPADLRTQLDRSSELTDPAGGSHSRAIVLRSASE